MRTIIHLDRNKADSGVTMPVLQGAVVGVCRGRVWTQKLVHQKWPREIRPSVNSIAFDQAPQRDTNNVEAERGRPKRHCGGGGGMSATKRA